MNPALNFKADDCVAVSYDANERHIHIGAADAALLKQPLSKYVAFSSVDDVCGPLVESLICSGCSDVPFASEKSHSVVVYIDSRNGRFRVLHDQCTIDEALALLRLAIDQAAGG